MYNVLFLVFYIFSFAIGIIVTFLDMKEKRILKSIVIGIGAGMMMIFKYSIQEAAQTWNLFGLVEWLLY
jgi:positive regulator of sigma E activity